MSVPLGQGDEGFFLAIDQGGHASRAVIFSDSGAVVSEATVDIQTQRPRPGWVEHEAEALVESVRAAIDSAAAPLRGGVNRLRAAGLATQRSNVVCWDRSSGAALSPVISWQDTRGARWLEALGADERVIHRRTGLPLSPHYGASKLRWCLDHRPAVRAALEEQRLAWGPMACFLLFRLLSQRPLLVDPVTASRTLLWDLDAQDWSAALLETFGLPREPLPRCVPNRYAFGDLDVAGRAVPLAVMTGDQPAALFAWGEPLPEVASVNIGTGAFVQRVLGEKPVQAPGLLSSVLWKEEKRAQYVLEGTVNGAGAAIETMADALRVDPRTLDAILDRSSEVPLFLNGISGLGSPYWVADFPSRFVGDGAPAAKLAAVAESILFLLAVNLRAMSDEVGAAERIEVSGGLATLDGLCQRLADLAGCAVVRRDSLEATARGLAWLTADRPAHWGGAPTGRTFSPRRDPPLAARFDAWRSHLASALP